MVKIRLRRMGGRNHPFYRIVVSDSRKVPTASAVEEVGYYNPRKSSLAVIDRERVEFWVKRGATLSPTVEKLVARAQREVSDAAPPEVTPTPETPSPAAAEPAGE